MRTLALAAAAALAACAAPRPNPVGVRTGLDVLEAEHFKPLRGLRVGVITNATGVDRAGRSVVDLLAAAPGVRLAAVFSPEHGFAAAREADSVASDRLTVAGRVIPLYSLYRGGAEGMRPTPEQLQGLDALVFDIQDVGVRFYTYAATMTMSMEAAKAAGLKFFVLDRPDPIGGDTVEGPIMDVPRLAGVDPVAYLPVSTRHGMTIGELAEFADARVGLEGLRVIKMRGWRRDLWFDQTGLPWVRPSPNMPDLAAAALYPGVGDLEFTNLSVGRGTPTPFGWIGAPWIDAQALADRLNAVPLEGVRFEPSTQTPTKDAYAGLAVPGVRLIVTDRRALRPLRVFTALVTALRDLYPDDFKLRWERSRRLIGLEEFRELYETGAASADIAARFDEDAARFREQRRPYLLYPER